MAVRWLCRIGIVLVALLLLALALLYGGSQWIISRRHDVPLAAVAIPHDAASVAEGGRLARIAGCRGCHGPEGRGLVLFEDAMVGRIAAPPLARAAANMSDAELVRTIRHGVHKDGSTLFVMPSPAFAHLADEDVARIVAWIRTLPPAPAEGRWGVRFGPLGRWLALSGAVPPKATAAVVAPARRPADHGRYFVESVCLACHKLGEDGIADNGVEKVPALAPVAGAYDPAAFRRLLRTGVAANGNAELGQMSRVARGDLQALSDDEIAAIHAYLASEAARIPPQ